MSGAGWRVLSGLDPYAPFIKAMSIENIKHEENQDQPEEGEDQGPMFLRD